MNFQFSNVACREDDCIPPLFRAKLSDYRDSGYDRGHLTPAADHKKRQESMDETFFLSNISPQVGLCFYQFGLNSVRCWIQQTLLGQI